MKGIEIQGGGSHGALTVGRLIARNTIYNKGGGTSTGALMLPLVLLGRFDILEEAYTSVKTKDITEVSAFTKKGRLNIPKGIARLTRSLLFKKYRTLGESKKLKNLIYKFVPSEVYTSLIEQDKEAIVYAYSISYEQLVGFKNTKESHKDFVDWMWASANAPVVFSLLEKERIPGNGDIEEWVDGGITDGHSAMKLIQEGCTEVDLFLHTPKPKIRKRSKIRNVPHFILRLISSQRKEIGENDLKRAIDAAKLHKACLRVHYAPHKLSSNSLVFDKKKMEDWVKLGKEIAFDQQFIENWDFRVKPIKHPNPSRRK